MSRLRRKAALSASSRHRWLEGERIGPGVPYTCGRCGRWMMIYEGDVLPRLGCSGMKRQRLQLRGRRSRREHGKTVFGPLCDHVRMMPCVNCEASPPSDPAHVRSRGAGFRDYLPNGDGNVVPMCRECHDNWYSLDRSELPAKAREVARLYEEKMSD